MYVYIYNVMMEAILTGGEMVNALAFNRKLQRLTRQSINLPPPGPRQCRVKILASAVHPADLLSIRNHYPHTSTIAGNDAVGVVIGDNGVYKEGQQVVVVQSDIGGVWTEEQNIDNDHLYVVDPPLPMKMAAGIRVNPGTAYQLLERYGNGNLLLSAANSQVGRYLLQLHKLQKYDSEIVGLVRSPERLLQMQRSFPHHHFYLQHNIDEWTERIKTWNKPAAALDCVGGDLATQMLTALPPKSTLCSYGALSGNPMQASVGRLVFEGKRVEGFWVSQWFREADTPVIRDMMERVCEFVRGGQLLLAPLEEVKFDDIVDGTELSSESLIVMP